MNKHALLLDVIAAVAMLGAIAAGTAVVITLVQWWQQ
jgi:hypothetical protein